MDTKILLLLCAVVAVTSAAVPVSRSIIRPQIVGGKVTPIEDVPYQLSLELLFMHTCGASLVSERYAVTAAHCVMGQPFMMRVRAGSSWTFILNWMGSTSGVDKATAHSRFSMETVDFDVAVLALKSPMKLSASIRPISLPFSGAYPPPGSKAIVSGWGVLHEWSIISAFRLRSLSLEIVSKRDCVQMYSDSPVSITDRMICAGRGGEGDSCQGDSGGPLAYNGQLVGIVSWGIGCDRPGKTGVYTSVANPMIREFIMENTNGL